MILGSLSVCPLGAASELLQLVTFFIKALIQSAGVSQNGSCGVVYDKKFFSDICRKQGEYGVVSVSCLGLHLSGGLKPYLDNAFFYLPDNAYILHHFIFSGIGL